MKKNYESEDVEKLLAEADELLKKINTEIIEDMEEERRAQFEENAQRLKKSKSEVDDKLEKQGTLTSISHGEGMHEAIEDIVKAMTSLKNYFH